MTGIQPSPFDPLGNPNYTAAYVIANGARWPVQLAITFNESLLEAYGLAQVGGVIDSSITPHGSDLVHQISESFLPTYGNSTSGNWSASSTLFITFFGVNDVNLVLPYQNSSTYLDKIFTSYGNSIEKVSSHYKLHPSCAVADGAIKLYDAGARNFLLLNEPPMDLAPKALPGLRPLISDVSVSLRGSFSLWTAAAVAQPHFAHLECCSYCLSRLHFSGLPRSQVSCPYAETLTL